MHVNGETIGWKQFILYKTVNSHQKVLNIETMLYKCPCGVGNVRTYGVLEHLFSSAAVVLEQVSIYLEQLTICVFYIWMAVTDEIIKCFIGKLFIWNGHGKTFSCLVHYSSIDSKNMTEQFILTTFYLYSMPIIIMALISLWNFCLCIGCLFNPREKITKLWITLVNGIVPLRSTGAAR